MLTKTKISILVTFLSLGICAQAQAQSPAPQAAAPVAKQEATPPKVQLEAEKVMSSSRGGVAGSEVQEINERNTVLRARLAEKELEAKIAAKSKEVRELNGSAQQSGYFGPITVLSVDGLKGSLEAVLSFQSGASQRVRAGDQIGNRRVFSVTLDDVVLTDSRGRKERIPVGATPSSSSVMPPLPGQGSIPQIR
jgi:type IV pilus biogenesis protein PilP